MHDFRQQKKQQKDLTAAWAATSLLRCLVGGVFPSFGD